MSNIYIYIYMHTQYYNTYFEKEYWIIIDLNYNY